MKQITSTTGIELIKRFEGLRLAAYLDAVRVPTIGYGHTKTARMGQKITAAQAEELLVKDLAVFEQAVNDLVAADINQNEFDALVSFAFNVGAGALNRSTLLRALNKGRRQAAADEFLRWNKAGGRVLAGLTRRRVAERALFLTPFVAPEAKVSEKPERTTKPRNR
jgi:GH24 family phage-related lysozyme (muramidase)